MNPQGPNDPNQGPDPLGGGQPPNNYPPQGQQPGQSGWPQQQPGSGWPQQQPPPGQYGQQPPPGQYGQQPPPGQYGQQPPPGQYGAGGYYPEQVNGTLILILGILSILGCFSVILGPVAWVMGNNALKAIAAGQADPAQQGNVSGGRICGIIGTILWIIGAICYVIFVGIAIATGGASHSSSF